MHTSFFDIIGILAFLAIARFIYKKSWFFSFYSFVKFILVAVTSLIIGLMVAQKFSVTIFLTKLQIQLLIEGVSFFLLWKFVSFKKVFFRVTNSAGKLNYFFFIHHIDQILSTIPSLSASFYVSFFLFTFLVTASTNIPILQSAIEHSTIVKPISYQIYFASLNNREFGLFNEVAFKTVPAIQSKMPNSNYIPTQNEPQIPPGQPEIGHFTPSNTPTRYINYKAPTPIPTTPKPSPTFIPLPTPAPTQIPVVITSIPPPYRIPTNQPVPSATPFIFPPTATPIPFIPPTPSTPIPTPTAALQTPDNGSDTRISQFEQDIFRLTNDQRVQNGVTPLIWSDALGQIARAHSQDMQTRNFFEHTNPDGLNPFQRMQNAGISFTTAGENIAGAPTADIIVDNWMHSPGHRANILNPAFGHLGVGVSVSSSYGLLATQDFTN